MALLVLITSNFFILIICLMGAQSCYFKSNWKWFWLMLVCVVMSSGCLAVVAYHLLTPPAKEESIFVRQPTTPL